MGEEGALFNIALDAISIVSAVNTFSWGTKLQGKVFWKVSELPDRFSLI